MSAKGYRQLRRRCEAWVGALGLPISSDAWVFCESLGRARGRRIVVVELPLQSGMPGTYGLWIKGEHIDFILVESETSRRHQNRIILHEAGHIICGHEPDVTIGVEIPAEILRKFFKALGPERAGRELVRGLTRRNRDSEVEEEAEETARVIEDWGEPSFLELYVRLQGGLER